MSRLWDAVLTRFPVPPKTDGVCDLDGSPLEVRPDDREEVVRERLEQYERQTQPLIEFFKKTSRRCYEVDANHGTPEEIFERIRAVDEPAGLKASRL